jgi:hypothetical protein
LTVPIELPRVTFGAFEREKYDDWGQTVRVYWQVNDNTSCYIISSFQVYLNYSNNKNPS